MSTEENIICTGDANFEMPKFGSYGEYILKETIKNGIQVLMVSKLILPLIILWLLFYILKICYLIVL